MSPLIAQAERKRGQIAPKDEANIDKLPELLQAYQKRSSLNTNGTSHGFALSFAFLSAASHRWRVHSSAAMASTTLNLPCGGPLEETRQFKIYLWFPGRNLSGFSFVWFPGRNLRFYLFVPEPEPRIFIFYLIDARKNCNPELRARMGLWGQSGEGVPWR
jgi:hypothetical protein